MNSVWQGSTYTVLENICPFSLLNFPPSSPSGSLFLSVSSLPCFLMTESWPSLPIFPLSVSHLPSGKPSNVWKGNRWISVFIFGTSVIISMTKLLLLGHIVLKTVTETKCDESLVPGKESFQSPQFLDLHSHFLSVGLWWVCSICVFEKVPPNNTKDHPCLSTFGRQTKTKFIS